MKTEPPAATTAPPVPYRQSLWVLLLLVASILAVTWPWVQTFSSAFLQHWDPPFHAWKLEFVARSLLAGHLLPPEGNTNMFYPQTGALYFEALHWPQALVAAPLFGLFHLNPVLVYHLVLVFFWALSGLIFWMLLLALGTTRRAALLGALLFTLMPYRISYMVEFNMQMCFGLPLFFFFMVRFFQRPSIRYACGMAVAWWLQASSELYQAFFLLLILPFPGLILMVAHRDLLRSWRRFWLPALCAAALGGTLTWVFLGPYLVMLDAHAVNRNLHEIASHILEPLSYLRPGGRFHFLAPLDVRRDEMIVYPTLAMILLTVAHFLFDARRLARIAVPRWVWILRAIRWAALISFMALMFIVYFFQISAHGHILASVLPIIATLASILVLLHPTERDTATLFITGLFAGAVFAFFMSMGPLVVLRHSRFIATSYLYDFIYQYVTLLQGFRVVSRFSIYLLIFMAIASALAWSQIERRWLQRPGWRSLWIAPLLLALAECIPAPFQTRPAEYPLASPVLDRLDRLEQPFVIAMAPMGDRTSDACYMLQIARTDRLFVYAWGGAYPHYTRLVEAFMSHLDPKPEPAAQLLRQLWPECFILEDKSFTHLLPIPQDYVRIFANETDVMAEDDRFALLRLKPESEPAPEQIRLIRHDFLVANPYLVFRARTPADIPSATLWLDLNGYVIGRWEIGPEPREFRLAVPPRNFLPLLPNRFRFHATDDAPFHLDSFAPGPATNPILAEPALELPENACPSWLGHLDEVPASAVPLNIQYRNGLEILACEPLQTSAPSGGDIRLRYYVECPRNTSVAMNMSIHSRLRAPGGPWIEEGNPLVTFGDSNDVSQVSTAATGDLNDILCQLHPAVYVLDQTIPIPERFVPGDYTLMIVLRDQKGLRVAGRQNEKRGKVFPVPIPIRILPQAPAGP